MKNDEEVTIPYRLLIDSCIYEIERGIRSVCQPHVAIDDHKLLVEIQEYVIEKDCGCIITNGNLSDIDTGEVKDAFRVLIIFHSKSTKKALALRDLIHKLNKTKADHRRMGRIYGYSRKSIKKFIRDMKSNGA